MMQRLFGVCGHDLKCLLNDSRRRSDNLSEVNHWFLPNMLNSVVFCCVDFNRSSMVSKIILCDYEGIEVSNKHFVPG